jgi:hypothetical protein
VVLIPRGLCKKAMGCNWVRHQKPTAWDIPIRVERGLSSSTVGIYPSFKRDCNEAIQSSKRGDGEARVEM